MSALADVSRIAHAAAKAASRHDCDPTQLLAALTTYAQRKSQTAHPDGIINAYGRWHPTSKEQRNCCALLRWSYCLLSHCRTAAHVAALHDLPLPALRTAINTLPTAINTLVPPKENNMFKQPYRVHYCESPGYAHAQIIRFDNHSQLTLTISAVRDMVDADYDLSHTFHLTPAQTHDFTQRVARAIRRTDRRAVAEIFQTLLDIAKPPFPTVDPTHPSTSYHPIAASDEFRITAYPALSPLSPPSANHFAVDPDRSICYYYADCEFPIPHKMLERALALAKSARPNDPASAQALWDMLNPFHF